MASEKTSLELIEDERQRQIKEEGYTPQEDAEFNTVDRLAAAAACYAIGEQLDILPKQRSSALPVALWPKGWRWNPKDRLANLIRAGALIAAAMDLHRAGGERPDTRTFHPIKSKEELDLYIRAAIEEQIEQGKLVRPQ